MGSRRKLTKAQEAEITRRRKLCIRCDEWLKSNDQRAIAKMYGENTKTVSSIHLGAKPQRIPEPAVRDIARRARHAAKVAKIRKRHCRFNIKKEDGISEERIDKLCPPPGKQTRAKTPVDDFLVMRLTTSPANDWTYYGRVAC